MLYNVRWKQEGQWISHDGFESLVSVNCGDIIVSCSLPGGLIALRVLQRVLTDPVTLIYARTVDPLSENEEAW